MRQVDTIPYKRPLNLKRTIVSAFVYLTIPIKHDNPDIESKRCDYATEIASYFHDAGIPVFSPASHGQPINSKSIKRQDWSYWSKIDLPILTCCCTHLVVICSPGWVDSTGVNSEILTARDVGIRVIYYDPSNQCRLRSIIDALLEWK